MKLFFAALPLRIRLDFETSRGFCGLAQNDAHCVPAAQMARPGCVPIQTQLLCHQAKNHE
ncbi:hypothetical protein [Lapidilactobacillus salsurivasis]